MQAITCDANDDTLCGFQAGAARAPRAARGSEGAAEPASIFGGSDDIREADILLTDTLAASAEPGAYSGTGSSLTRQAAFKALAFLVDPPRGVALRLLTGVSSSDTTLHSHSHTIKEVVLY